MNITTKPKNKFKQNGQRMEKNHRKQEPNFTTTSNAITTNNRQTPIIVSNINIFYNLSNIFQNSHLIAPNGWYIGRNTKYPDPSIWSLKTQTARFKSTIGNAPRVLIMNPVMEIRVQLRRVFPICQIAISGIIVFNLTCTKPY